MRVLLTGGSGYLGAFTAPALAAAGHAVLHLARRPPADGAPWRRWDLAATPPLPPADALVHLALDHAPGRFRGGEGDEPERRLRLNVDGSLALFAAARAAGAARIVFLSSRAVYGDARRGATLREGDQPEPDSLYGAAKLAVERGAPDAASLRATGVYGLAPGATKHKWSALFGDYLAGRPVAPRAATELHGADLAEAVVLLLAAPAARGPFNASDLLLDRRDLLAAVRARVGSANPLPAPARAPPPGVMATDRLHALGWRPGGVARLDGFLDGLFGPARPAARGAGR